MIHQIKKYAQLSELMEDFYCLTKIRISFWNDKFQKCAMAPSTGDSDFCRELRKIDDINIQCSTCDRLALKEARELGRGLFCFNCGAGLKEYVYPAYYRDSLLGYFMFGQVRNHANDTEGNAQRQRLYYTYRLDEAYMTSLYQKLPPVEESLLLSAGRMLSSLASYAHLNNLLGSQNEPLAERLLRYIENNFKEPVSIESACIALYTSRSTLCHTIRKDLNSTFLALLNQQRIENVKACLTNGQSVAEAAFNSGFQSASYMTRIFRRLAGDTPSQYQAGLHSPKACTATQPAFRVQPLTAPSVIPLTK